MSFNIDCRFCDLQKETSNTWRQRTKNIKDTFERYNPDIIGIQEPIFKLDVLQLMPPGYKPLFFDEANWVPWGSYPDATIAYNTTRLEPKDFKMFWLGPNPSLPFGFDRFALPRLAIYAMFEDKIDGTKFYFGTTHFDHGDDLEGNNVDCTQSSYELLNFTAPIADKYPFIWTGDFNSETSNSNAYGILTNESAPFYLEDSYFHSPTHTVVSNEDPIPTYDYNVAIDHIFFPNNFEVAKYVVNSWSVDMFVYGDEKHYASDHFAIISDIEIQKPAVI